MKWAYAWRELKMHPGMMCLLFIQTVTVYIVAICMISSVTSRYDRFHEISHLISGDGRMVNIINLNQKNNKYCAQKQEDIKDALPNTEVAGCYNWSYSISGDTQEVVLTGYDDELWKSHTPELCSGRWFRDSDKKTDELEVVIAQKNGKQGRYQVGDLLVASREFAMDATVNNDEHDIKLKIIGILDNGATVLGNRGEIKDEEDYRSLFWDYYDYYEDQMYIWGIQSDLYQFKMKYALSWFTKMGGLCFFKWTTNDSKIISLNEEYFMTNGAYLDMKKYRNIRKKSEAYVYEQIRFILPILITLCLMTILSTACNMAILVKKSLRHYAIYYINGLNWNSCIRIHERCTVLLEFGTLFVAIFCLVVIQLLGITRNTVISIGVFQILGCLVLSLVFSMVGIFVAKRETSKCTVRDILREGGNI